MTYIIAFHARSKLFNGYFVHSRGANAAGLTAEQLGRDPEPIPAGARLRTDYDRYDAAYRAVLGTWLAATD